MNGLAERWAEELAAVPPGPAPGWLHELRDRAAGQFRAGGLPHRIPMPHVIRREMTSVISTWRR